MKYKIQATASINVDNETELGTTIAAIQTFVENAEGVLSLNITT